MSETKALHGRLVEAARLLGSDGVDWCPEEREGCGIDTGIDADGLDGCQRCWLVYLETGE